MFVGYGKHPFLIALRLQTQGIELAIATRSVGDFQRIAFSIGYCFKKCVSIKF